MSSSRFDAVAIVDWSGGNDRGRTPKKDAIWIAVAQGGQIAPPVYCRNRQVAEAELTALIDLELAKGRRLLIGFDFPFGYPVGVARALTGSDSPFAVWEWLADRIEDTPKLNNRFDLAGQINLVLGEGAGPFWGNGLRREIPGLPRTKAGYWNPFAERRQCEISAVGAFTCWQLAGAGAVGSQVLMGLPVLWRLRHRRAGAVAVWPYDTLDRSVALVEVWPSLIRDAVRAGKSDSEILDRAQTRILAKAVARLNDTDALADMLHDVPQGAPQTEEGWILGLGHEARLASAAS